MDGSHASKLIPSLIFMLFILSSSSLVAHSKLIHHIDGRGDGVDVYGGRRVLPRPPTPASNGASLGHSHHLPHPPPSPAPPMTPLPRPPMAPPGHGN